jgi:hypothetical protein
MKSIVLRPFLLLSGLLFLMLMCSLQVGAQEVASEKKVSKDGPVASAYISVVALGPIPSRRYKMPGEKVLKSISKRQEDEKSSASGVPKMDSHAGQHAVLLPHLLGTVPPPALYFKPQNPLPGHSRWERLRVGFNNATGIKRVTSEKQIKLYLRGQEGGDSYDGYMDLEALPPATQSLIFLFPNGKGKRPWKKSPKVKVLHVSSKLLKNKNVLLQNYSSKNVTFILGDKKLNTLKPAQKKSLKLSGTKEYHRLAAIESSKKKEYLVNTSIRASQKALTVIVFYDANPKTNAGRSVGVFRTTVNKLGAEVLNKVSKVK